MADEKNSAIAKEPKKSSGKKEPSIKGQVKEKTGIELAELVKAPIKPPEIKDDRKPTSKQHSLFIRGVITIIVGLILYPFGGFGISVAIIVIGIIVIAISVLIRVEDSKEES